MEKPGTDPRLTQISTQWTLVFQVHRGGSTAEVQAAQVALINRYAGAVHRYLLGAVRDPEVAAELDQEFALRFLRGDFHRADPSRGRFRDFIKRSLRNMMVNHFKAAKRAPRPLGASASAEPAIDEVAFEAEFDRQFVESWRKEVLDRAWAALDALQKRTGQPYYSVLRCRVENPDLRSPELAEKLATQLGRPVTAGGVRQALLRSREKFVDFLLEEVSGALENPTDDDVEQELIDLGLIEYCRPVLQARRKGGG